MELREGDAVKLNGILSYVECGNLISDRDIPNELELSYPEYIRLKTMALFYNAIQLKDETADAVIQMNNNTRNYLAIDYFGELYQKQQADKRRQDEIDEERRINIKNGRWALTISLASIVIAILAFLKDWLLGLLC